MKLTRYEQSCLLLEQGDTRILIDPGTPFTSKHELSKLGKLDAVFITHEHADHFDKQAVEKLAEQTVIYVNESTSKQLTGQKKVVADGETITAGNFTLKVVELPHCLMPDGSAGPQNTGYLINETLFHPGDGIELQGLRVDNLALPIIGPDVSPKDAFKFARDVSAKRVIPIHYDIFGVNAAIYAQFAERYSQPFKMIVLQSGESIQL